MKKKEFQEENKMLSIFNKQVQMLKSEIFFILVNYY